MIRRRAATALAIAYLLLPTATIPAMTGMRPRWLPAVRLAVGATYVAYFWLRRNESEEIVYLRKPS